MNLGNAKFLLENLIGRMEQDGDAKRWKLEGSISSLEMDALQTILETLSTVPIDSSSTITEVIPEKTEVAVNTAEQRKEEAPVQEPADENDTQAVNLVTTALTFDSPQNPDITLCLDFGTAMSKAAASRGVEDEFLELKLGEQAKQDGIAYPVVSSVFISDSGMVYFGQESVKQSMVANIAETLRFDSLKQEITLGRTDSSLDKQLVDDKFNPTDLKITKGCLITIYLAYLTDLACSSLEEQHGVSRYVKRRYALPVFPEDHSRWVKQQLQLLLSRAQILADTFHGQWQDGIELSKINNAYQQLLKLDKLPDYLIGDSVLEPIAAASSRIQRDEGAARELVMIVDVGAGTTDFALFLVSQDADKEIFKAFLIPDTVKGVRQAGDAIDNALRIAILENSHIDNKSSHFDLINSNLQRYIRSYKETLFDTGTLHYTLADDSEGTIYLNDFLNRGQVKKFESLLEATFLKILQSVDSSYLDFFQNLPIKVVLTGGGATLPMIQGLGNGIVKFDSYSISRQMATLVPDWVIDNYPYFEDEYPQLAVALGGACSALPEPGPSFAKFYGLGGKTNQWHVEKFQ
ncbi:MAG: hypothetical protein HON51_00585 [Gammaproteobacteria bacterium]|jgi:hypothetical protein|nr:hypothetical protein [Gammaproteobacteria bacterium]MBT6419375.1 hypothetical protein [Gammaproteobacteria bacterium]MBT6574736.1 hypothetical protein [Gammaproteobacteria bacterium]